MYIVPSEVSNKSKERKLLELNGNLSVVLILLNAVLDDIIIILYDNHFFLAFLTGPTLCQEVARTRLECAPYMYILFYGHE